MIALPGMDRYRRELIQVSTYINTNGHPYMFVIIFFDQFGFVTKQFYTEFKTTVNI